MNSVVMIAYFFPPEGAAGSHRPLRFVRQLPKVGWCPAIISTYPHRYERYDPDLLSLIPRDMEVMRVRSFDPWQTVQGWREHKLRETLSNASTEAAAQIRATHEGRLRSRIREAVRMVEAWCYRPDMAMTWIRPAVN